MNRYHSSSCKTAYLIMRPVLSILAGIFFYFQSATSSAQSQSSSVSIKQSDEQQTAHPIQVPVQDENQEVVILVSGAGEWEVIQKEFFSNVPKESTPYGEWFLAEMPLEDDIFEVAFFYNGPGAIFAGGATQYAIDRWSPKLMIHLGVCNGFEGSVNKEELLIVERIVASATKITTDIDLSWLGAAATAWAKKGVIASGDKPIQTPAEMANLKNQFGALAWDRESASVSSIASVNKVRLLVIKSVACLLGNDPKAYEKQEIPVPVLKKLLDESLKMIPFWISRSSLEINEAP
ncbi:MAG: hypothetical protein JW774_00865 [Candidatus Aureabacteria bacterium]|nr:hypothetical protein [Candidatus Auribacterota bacterium]